MLFIANLISQYTTACGCDVSLKKRLVYGTVLSACTELRTLPNKLLIGLTLLCKMWVYSEILRMCINEYRFHSAYYKKGCLYMLGAWVYCHKSLEPYNIIIQRRVS